MLEYGITQPFEKYTSESCPIFKAGKLLIYLFKFDPINEHIYTIKIKKEYASAVIEDLKQADAIEIMEEPVPEWQKAESVKRLSEMKVNPSSALSKKNFSKL